MNGTSSDHRLRKPFRLLWERLGADSTPADDIVEHYSEPGRSYHGVAHLQDCLTTLDEHRDEAEQPDRVFRTKPFRSLEGRARENLECALIALER